MPPFELAPELAPTQILALCHSQRLHQVTDQTAANGRGDPAAYRSPHVVPPLTHRAHSTKSTYSRFLFANCDLNWWSCDEPWRGATWSKLPATSAADNASESLARLPDVQKPARSPRHQLRPRGCNGPALPAVDSLTKRLAISLLRRAWTCRSVCITGSEARI